MRLLLRSFNSGFLARTSSLSRRSGLCLSDTYTNLLFSTSSKKERLQEYLAVEYLAPLTDEEIFAIEEAGAKGPPRANTIASTVRRVIGSGSPSYGVLVLLMMIVLLVLVRAKY